ncbi:PepSY-associated TM helix domain-containing protein [Thalassotalea profundi]|uniref:Peptidase n=1 Tax=Thalassotalea profundi TaxID=2036687 RepID=A0ABQ3IRQ8_9GAMM|nr:PepSY domain-containing protein [Thalassotalea profundi]GHE88983.1 peptidase [Thalassotalea profundi]
MRASTVKVWELIHKWTSLICTAFLLMLCITGLPLIFHDEIDDALNPDVWQPKSPDATPLTLDEILTIALNNREGEQAIYMSFDIVRPVVNVTSGPTADAPGTKMHFASYDLTSGDLVPPADVGESVMEFILQLHTDMFLELPGMLFLGAMGILFILSTISGVVIYRQYMRKLRFGTVRKQKSTRHKWLDYHNLLGIVTIAWVLVVGLTGVINTLEKPILDTWRDNNLKQLLSEHQGGTIAQPVASLSEAVKQAKLAAPDMTLQFVAFPGSNFSSNQHYAIFLHGNTPLTKELITPVLVDAVSGEVIGLSEMPWYAKALSLSRPLHFGDYGGLFLKILWAILDVLTIIILGSGLYLWVQKNKKLNRNTPTKNIANGVTQNG